VNKYLILMLVVTVTSGAAWLAWAEYRDVVDQLERAEDRIEGYERSAEIHRKYLAKMREINSDWDALSNELQQKDGADAPLDSYLLDASRRLWP
jgi:hypothetical protein